MPPSAFAGVYHALGGNDDKVFALLEKAYEQRSLSLLAVKYEPLFDNLRADPRYQDLMQRIERVSGSH